MKTISTSKNCLITIDVSKDYFMAVGKVSPLGIEVHKIPNWMIKLLFFLTKPKKEKEG